jgi:hypothetical protein
MTMTGRHAAASIMTVIPVSMTSGPKPFVKSQNYVMSQFILLDLPVL